MGKKKVNKTSRTPSALLLLGFSRKQIFFIVLLGFLFTVFLLAAFATTIKNENGLVLWILAGLLGISISSIIIFGKK